LGLGALVIFIVIIIAILSQSQNKLVYVFEVVRHGARAPYAPGDFGFKIHRGMLTAQGMRQRYLLGKYRYLQYNAQLDFDSILKAPVVKNLDEHSTDVYRTIQSSYSELMGLQEGSAKTP